MKKISRRAFLSVMAAAGAAAALVLPLLLPAVQVLAVLSPVVTS